MLEVRNSGKKIQQNESLGVRGGATGYTERQGEQEKKRGGGKGINFLWKHPLFP